MVAPKAMRWRVARLCAGLALMPLVATTVFAADASLDDLLARLEARRQAAAIPALGLTVVSSNEVLYAGAFGVRDLDTREPVDEHTVFRIGSITKTFTGLAMLLLDERGIAKLDDPVRRHLTPVPFINPWQRERPIRVAHLLEHTAGFQDMVAAEWAVKTPLSLEEAFAVAPSSRTAQWPPAMHSSYSNSGAGVAAAVLEAATGEAFEQFLADELFTPLAMGSASLAPTTAVRRQLATGYDRDGRTPMLYWHMLYRAFGAINVTPAHMAPLLQLLLGEGTYRGRRLFSPEAIHRLETPQTTLAAQGGLTWGYGLGNYSWARAGVVWHGHGGDADGYLAHYGYSRVLDRGYFLVITTFQKAPLRALRREVEDFLGKGTVAPDAVPAAPLSAAALDRFTGTYRTATRRFPGSEDKPMVIERDGARLRTRVDGGRWRSLVPVTDHHFRRPWEPVATAAFVRNHEGVTCLQGDMGNYCRVTR